MNRGLAAYELNGVEVLEDQPSRAFTAYSVGVAGAAILAAVGCAVLGPSPSLTPVLVLGSLLAFAENQVVALPRANISGSLMIATAAAAVFEPRGDLLGPLLVGMCGALYLPNVLSFDWRRLCINLGNFALAGLAAACAYVALVRQFGTSGWALAIVSLPVALAFVVTNDVVVAGAYALYRRQSFSAILREFRISDLQSIPFALLGVFMGRLYSELGPAALPLFIVPILMARQSFSSYLELKNAQEAMVRTLIRALEAKDPYTSGHAERVAVYAQYMGGEFNFAPRRMERLRFAALMHDIGKLIVPNHLLNKPGKLTEEEFAQVRKHEDVSVEVLGRIDFLRPVAPSASSEFSHYRPDEAKHPIEPYIVHVADAYDAMTSTRSYRKALPQEIAFGELRDKAGTQFHPDAVEALITAVEKRNECHGAGHEHDVHDWVVAPPEVGLGSAGLGDLAPDAKQHKQATP